MTLADSDAGWIPWMLSGQYGLPMPYGHDKVEIRHQRNIWEPHVVTVRDLDPAWNIAEVEWRPVPEKETT